MKCSMGLLLAALAFPTVALAAESPVEASMVLTGTVTVGKQGDVADYTLHDENKLPPAVVRLVQRTIKTWQFVPIVEDGRVVAAKAGMAVRVVADRIDESHVKIRVAGAQFGCDAYQAKDPLPNACPPGTTITYAANGRRPPQYPLHALKEGLGGEVYMAVEVGRDGRVIRAKAKQVNLFNRIGTPDAFRKVFAESASAAASAWRFEVPTVGPQANKDHWTVLIPVVYTIGRPTRAGYGQWSAYIPGSVQDIPWAKDDAAGSTDAVTGSGVPFVRDPRFVLKMQGAADDARS